MTLGAVLVELHQLGADRVRDLVLREDSASRAPASDCSSTVRSPRADREVERALGEQADQLLAQLADPVAVSRRRVQRGLPDTAPAFICVTMWDGFRRSTC